MSKVIPKTQMRTLSNISESPERILIKFR